MTQFLHALMLTFIPMFVAIDPIGILPIYLGVTVELTPPQRRRVMWQALLTSLVLSLGFLLIGKVLFKVLNITQYDFQVGGGLILLTLAVIDIVHVGKERRRPEGPPTFGVVPLGTPLIVGPALLTTLLLLVDLHTTLPGHLALGVSLVINLMLVMVVFMQAERLSKRVGPSGMAAVSKVFSLFLAAIAVMMIRRGIIGMMDMPV